MKDKGGTKTKKQKQKNKEEKWRGEENKLHKLEDKEHVAILNVINNPTSKTQQIYFPFQIHPRVQYPKRGNKIQL